MEIEDTKADREHLNSQANNHELSESELEQLRDMQNMLGDDFDITFEEDVVLTTPSNIVKKL